MSTFNVCTQIFGVWIQTASLLLDVFILGYLHSIKLELLIYDRFEHDIMVADFFFIMHIVINCPFTLVLAILMDWNEYFYLLNCRQKSGVTLLMKQIQLFPNKKEFLTYNIKNEIKTYCCRQFFKAKFFYNKGQFIFKG